MPTDNRKCDLQFAGCPEKSSTFIRLAPMVKGGKPSLACWHCWSIAFRDYQQIKQRRGPAVSVAVRQPKRAPVKRDDGGKLFERALNEQSQKERADWLFGD